MAMAGLFGVGGPLGPMSPGLSGAVNPLAIIGAGIYQNNPLGAFQTMGNLQQAGQQLQFQQLQNQQLMQRHQAEMELKRQQAEQERRRREAGVKAAKLAIPSLMNLYAPDASEEQIRGMRESLEAQAEAYPQQVSKAAMGAMAPDPSNALKIWREQGGKAGTGKTFQDFYSEDYKGAGTTVTVGGPGDFGTVPSGMARVPDETSPTGSRLVPEPGSPELEKREKAQKELIAPLDSLEDALERYRQVLREVGPEIMTGRGKARLQTAYKELLIKQKEADELGALTGPDLDLVQSGLIDPTSWTAQWYEKTGQAKALEEQLDQAKRGISDARARARGEEPKRPQGTRQNPVVLSGTDEEVQAQFEDLGSGSYYKGPDGVLRQKP